MRNLQKSIRILVLVSLVLIFFHPSQSVSAAACGDVTITDNVSSPSSSDPLTFYYDISSGNDIQGMYVGYTITNTTGSTVPDVWVKLDTFSVSTVILASGEDGVYHVGPLAAGQSKPVYFYLVINGDPGDLPALNETFQVNIYYTDPALGSEVCDFTDTIDSVDETIAAVANKIFTQVAGPNPPNLGGIMTITGVGETGTVGAAQIFQLSPAAASDWPADDYKMVDVHVDYWDGTVCPDSDGSTPAGAATNTFDNQLIFSTPTTANSCYKTTYTFIATGTTTAATALTPNNTISSGEEIKHTGTTPALLTDIQLAANTTTLSKSVDPAEVATGGTVTYSVVISNSGGIDVTLDEIQDIMPTGVTYEAGSTTLDSTPIGDPLINSQTLIWSGSFVIPAGGSSTLTYQAVIPNLVGGYENSLVGFVGSDQIDTTISTADDAPSKATVTDGAAPTITKSFSPTVILPGSTSTLTITLSNANGSDLTGAAFTDTYPDGLVNADPTGASSTCGGGTLTAIAGEATLGLSGGTIPALSSCTISVDVTAAAEGTYTNTIGVGGLTNTQELPNDAAASDDLLVQGLGIAKSIADTSQTNTSGANVSIGEIATFQIVLTIPAVTVPDVVVNDTLPEGLAFVDCTSITPSSVNVTTDLGGGFVDACNDAVNPTVLNDGTTIQFNLGNITNSSATDETLTIAFTAVVTNVAGNQDGTSLSNSATVNWTGGTKSSDPTTLTVDEPSLSVTKNVSATTGDGGDQITYTVEVTNPVGSINAYDVSLYDYVPAEVVYDAGSFSNTSGLAPDAASDDPMPLNASWSVFPVGSTSVFQFTGTISGTIDAADTIYNDAIVKFTSLPGTPGSLSTYNTLAYERTGTASDPGGTANDYTLTGSASVTINMPYVHKITPTPGTYTIGEEVIYPLLVTLPEGTSLSLLIEDAVPGGLEYVSSEVVTQAALSGGLLAEDFSGSALSPTISVLFGDTYDWTFGDVVCTADAGTPAPDNNKFVIFVHTRVLNDPGNVSGSVRSNYATVQFLNPDTGGPVSITDGPVSISLVEPTLTITKTFTPDQAAGGETVQITLEVENTGTSPAYDVVIEDLLPTATFASVAEGTTPGDFTFQSETSGSDYRVSYTGGPIEVGGTRSFVFNATLGDTFASGTTFENTATISQATTISGESDYERDEPDVTASDTLTGSSPDLSLTKDDGFTAVTAGDTPVYSIGIENTGTHDAQNITVSDTVPTGTVFDAAGGTAGWSCSDGDPAGTACTYDIASLAAGADTSLSFAVRVDNPIAAGITQIENTVSVADDGVFGTDPTPENNSASDIDTLEDTSPQMDFTKTDELFTDADSSGNVSAGDTLRYTVTITNNGNQVAGSVVFTDSAPANTSLVVGSVTTTTGSVTTGNTAGDSSVSVALGDLDGAGGGTATVTFDVLIDDPLDAGVTSISNQGVISGSNFSDGSSDDPDVAGDVDPTITLLNNAVVKSVSETNLDSTTNPHVAIGEIITYQIVMNVAPGEANSSLLTDTLPEGIAFVDCLSIESSSADLTTDRADGFSGACSNPTVSEAPAGSTEAVDQGRVVEFDLGNLSSSSPATETLTVLFRAVVLDSLGNQNSDSLANSAVWSFEGGSLTAASVAVQVAEPEMEILKSANATSVKDGDVITFTITVRHATGSAADAYNVEFQDALPSELVYQTGTLAQVSGTTAVLDDSDPQNLKASWDEFPLAGEAAVITFDVQISGLDAGESVRNSVSLTWSSLPDEVGEAQSIYNTLSTERSFVPDSEVDVYGGSASEDITAPAPTPRPTPTATRTPLPTLVPTATNTPWPKLPVPTSK